MFWLDNDKARAQTDLGPGYEIKPLTRFLSHHFLSEGVVPGRPKELEVTEATKNYVVLSWKPPGERGHEGIMYYVEKVSYTVYTSLTSHT